MWARDLSGTHLKEGEREREREREGGEREKERERERGRERERMTGQKNYDNSTVSR